MRNQMFSEQQTLRLHFVWSLSIEMSGKKEGSLQEILSCKALSIAEKRRPLHHAKVQSHRMEKINRTQAYVSLQKPTIVPVRKISL